MKSKNYKTTEEQRANALKNYYKNHEKRKQQMKEYRENHPELVSYSARYRRSLRGMIISRYLDMKKRVEGRCVESKKYPHLWIGKELVNRELFIKWSLGNKKLKKLHKEWVEHNYDRCLSPSIDRIDTNKGYSIENMRWVTASENSSYR